MQEHTTETKLPAAALELQTLPGYFLRFYTICYELQCSHSYAYGVLEREYFSYFGRNKYNNYESFKSAKWRFYHYRNRRSLSK